jgi:iron complex outermembrane receptor protein
VEAELAVSPWRSLQLSAAGTYLDKKINSLDVSLPATLPPSLLNPGGISSFVFYGAPDWSFNLGADYTWPLGDVGDVRLSAKYFQISRVVYGSVNAPGYERTDFRATWQNILKSRLDVSAFVTNAFDKVGVISAGSSTVGLGASSVIYNEPRIWGMQLHYSFGGGQ